MPIGWSQVRVLELKKNVKLIIWCFPSKKKNVLLIKTRNFFYVVDNAPFKKQKYISFPKFGWDIVIMQVYIVKLKTCQKDYIIYSDRAFVTIKLRWITTLFIWKLNKNDKKILSRYYHKNNMLTYILVKIVVKKIDEHLVNQKIFFFIFTLIEHSSKYKYTD